MEFKVVCDAFPCASASRINRNIMEFKDFEIA